MFDLKQLRERLHGRIRCGTRFSGIALQVETHRSCAEGTDNHDARISSLLKRAEALGSDEAHLRVVALDPLLQLVRVWNPPGENLFTGINEDRTGISKKLVQHIS